MPKYLVFIFEGNMNNDSCYIPGNITASLIEPETIIKDKKYYLIGGIGAHTINHFTAFVYNYQLNFLNFEKGNNYYYEGMNYKGGIIKLDNI